MALGKHTDQSSYSSSSDDSYKAVDGNSNTSSIAGLCSVTNLELNPWWRVDLGRMEPVSEVYVVNSGDCCTNRLNPFEIRVGWSISIIIFISDSVIKNGKDITDISEPHRLVLGRACASLYKARNLDPAFFIYFTDICCERLKLKRAAHNIPYNFEKRPVIYSYRCKFQSCRHSQSQMW